MLLYVMWVLVKLAKQEMKIDNKAKKRLTKIFFPQQM